MGGKEGGMQGGKGQGQGMEEEDWLAAWWFKGLKQDIRILKADWFFTVQFLTFFTADIEATDFTWYTNVDMFFFYTWAILWTPLAWILSLALTILMSPFYLYEWVMEVLVGEDEETMLYGRGGQMQQGGGPGGRMD